MNHTAKVALCGGILAVLSCATATTPQLRAFDPSGYFLPTAPLPSRLSNVKWLELWARDSTGAPASLRGSLRVADPASPIGFTNLPIRITSADSGSLAFEALSYPGGSLSFRGHFTRTGIFSELPDNTVALTGTFATSGLVTDARFTYTVGD